MTPEQIEEMRRDMEAGTPGPWVVTEAMSSWGDEWFGCGVSAPGRVEFVWLEDEAETDIPLVRRIARVPQLEAEVLRLRAALESCVRIVSHPVSTDINSDGHALRGPIAASDIIGHVFDTAQTVLKGGDA